MINLEKPEIIKNSQKTDSDLYLENMREKIATRLEFARNNPITLGRLLELEEKLAEFDKKFFNSGYRDTEQIIAENAIEKEILEHSAIADNLIEFKEMLKQLGQTYREQIENDYENIERWAEDLLSHENAHANVAQSLNHEWVGYVQIFYEDNNGNIGIQPAHVTKPRWEWGPKEVLENTIRVVRAPEEYGNKLSDGDKIDLERANQRLKEM